MTLNQKMGMIAVLELLQNIFFLDLLDNQSIARFEHLSNQLKPNLAHRNIHHKLPPFDIHILPTVRNFESCKDHLTCQRLHLAQLPVSTVHLSLSNIFFLPCSTNKIYIHPSFES